MQTRLILLLVYLLCVTSGLLCFASGRVFADKRATPTPSPAATPAVTQPVKPQPAATTEPARLDGKFYLIGLVGALGLMLPLPLCLYHLRRVRLLMSQIEELQQKLREQEALGARVDSLLSRNEKLETELKNMQERFRVTVRNEQEKNQASMEKLKSDMHTLELENKRLSGLLMLKEQMGKKG